MLLQKNLIEFCKKIDVYSAGNFNKILNKKIILNKKRKINLINLDSNFAVIRKSRYLNSNKKNYLNVILTEEKIKF